MKLKKEELLRYARHLSLPGIGTKGQEKLKASKVLCIGAGGLGSPVLLYLAAAGIGTIGIVDDDVVAIENLQRQVLYNNKEVGLKKVDVAAKRLKAFNPHININIYPVRLNEKNIDAIIAEYDIVADCSDNFATRYLINDACLRLQKPDVSASVLQFEGQCSVFCAPNGPCYCCLYDAPPPQDLIPTCAETGIMGVLPGLLGTIQVNEIIKLILNIGEPLIGELLTVNTLNLEFRKRSLKRNPVCHICGNKNYYDLGGTLRSKPTTETLNWLESMPPDIGITRVANVTGLDNIGIDTATCIRPNSKHLSVSQGKGLSLELAKISAIMEAIEGYHAENPPKICFTGSYLKLKNKYNLIHPHKFNRTAFTEKSLDDMKLAWTCAHDLASDKIFYIPHVLTCLDFDKAPREYAFLNVSSNGLAAGNTLDEAICHALYEVIERDSLFRWQQLSVNARNKTQIDVNTITFGINKLLLDRFIAAGHIVKIWEISSKLKVPAFHCAIYDPNAVRGLGIFTGTGCHLSKDVALSRALTEAAQSKLTLISGNRDDIFPDYYKCLGTGNAVMEDQIEGTRSYTKCYNPKFEPSFKANVKQIITILNAKKFNQVLLVDHTKPEIKVPVVQAFVPGLGFNGSRM